jgi:RimJ/RimL family protein N-acetyltransferase
MCDGVQIVTPRLILRRMTMADVPALHVALSDPETMRYWSTLPHQSIEPTEAWVDGTISAVSAGDADDFAVTRDGEVIGKAGLWRGEELGILIARAYWGCGYGAEAVQAVVARAFACGHPRIEADVDPRNTACLALLKRAGFRQTGEARRTFQIGEEWTDSVYLTLTPNSGPAQFCG